MKKIVLALALLVSLLSCGNNRYGDRAANGDTIIILQPATDTIRAVDSSMMRNVVQAKK